MTRVSGDLEQVDQDGASFYSLHRETFSVTVMFIITGELSHRFYSLHRETFSVTPGSPRGGRAFAGFYSLHRETFSVTRWRCAYRLSG